MRRTDWQDIIVMVRRAPLKNMDEAEAIAALLKRFAEFAKDQLEDDELADKPQA